jgi:hypothetical protein
VSELVGRIRGNSRLYAGQPKNIDSVVGGRDLFCFLHVKVSSGAHPGSIWWVPNVLSVGYKVARV